MCIKWCAARGDGHVRVSGWKEGWSVGRNHHHPRCGLCPSFIFADQYLLMSYCRARHLVVRQGCKGQSAACYRTGSRQKVLVQGALRNVIPVTGRTFSSVCSPDHRIFSRRACSSGTCFVLPVSLSLHLALGSRWQSNHVVRGFLSGGRGADYGDLIWRVWGSRL